MNMNHRKLQARRYIFGTLLRNGAIILGVICAITVFGIVGRSDFYADMGLKDDWSTAQYAINIIVRLVLIPICVKASQIGKRFRDYCDCE